MDDVGFLLKRRRFGRVDLRILGCWVGMRLGSWLCGEVGWGMVEVGLECEGGVV